MLLLSTLIIANNLIAHSSIWVMAVGETRVLYPSKEDTVWISDKSIIKASEHNDGIILTAKKTGLASVRISDIGRDIRVLSKKMARAYFSFHKNKSDNSNISINQTTLIIGGKIESSEPWKRLSKISIAQSVKYKMLAFVELTARSEVRQWLQERFTKSFLPKPNIQFAPVVKLTFPECPMKLQKQILKVARTLGLEPEFNSQYIAKEQRLEISLEFVELAKSVANQLGLQWPESMTPGLNSSLIDQLKRQMILHAIEDSANGQILARPTLTTRNNQPVSFHSGGEFPLRSRTYKNSTVLWKSYGMTFYIRPHLAGDLINIHLKVDISHVDGASSIDGIPGIKKTSIESNIQVLKNRTALLTGVVLKQTQRDEKGLPWLQKIPIFAKLFSSASYRNKLSELVLFITPRVL